MTGPLVSIVLPTHNGAKYLAISVESCLQQTYSNIELIIVDDCSTDNTPTIIQSFVAKDQRVKYIRNEQNKKLPLSLNTGFEVAKGQYFTWTSDDNYYTPQAIETMVKTLQANPHAGLVYCNYTTIDDDGKITGKKIFNDVNNSMVKWLGCGACFLYEARLHAELKGYDASAFLIEDYDFFIRALTKTKFVYIPQTDLYYYRLHAASLTSLYGYYNFDLQKIVIERRLPELLTIASRHDQALWLRKFAIYYGVSKNNTARMHHYLQRLYSVSKSQTLLTCIYIIYRKIITGIVVSFSVVASFFRLLFGIISKFKV
jgi:glycosyltransferase involved in cell wall biosynthesis